VALDRLPLIDYGFGADLIRADPSFEVSASFVGSARESQHLAIQFREDIMLTRREAFGLRVAVALFFVALAASFAAEAKAAAKDQLKFQVYQDASQQFRWRLVTTDDKDPKVMATGGQGYKAKADCLHGVKIIQDGSDKLNFEVYQDNGGDYRWRAKSSNGQVVGSSASGYKAKADCQGAIDLIKKAAPKAAVEDAKDAKS
jgi:uncharacterized protein YegP (UPF0339 family)